MPCCLVVQHVEPEGPWAIAEVLKAAQVDISTVRIHLGERLPREVAGFDGLVVMGGPMSAVSDHGFPSRRDEIALLARAVGSNMPVLGVCLGAQLLAVAAGSSVTIGTDGPEVGWGPVQLTAAAEHDALFAGLPPRLTVLHWHSDTFSLPPGAVRLASSPRYKEQAFRLGSSAWGLQFHIEVSAVAVDGFLGTFGADAVAAGSPPETIAAATPNAVRALARYRRQILDRFVGLVAKRQPRGVGDLVERV